jgi:hypothetical protein
MKLGRPYPMLVESPQIILCDDVISIITKYLSNRNIINFLSISHHYHTLKGKIWYHQLTPLNKIQNLRYVDQFLNVIFCNDCQIYPKHMTHLTLGYEYWTRDWCLALGINNTFIPSTVTHLKFAYDLNKPLTPHIPKTITHLELGGWFNKDIEDQIPLGVTHLTFGDHFTQNIEGKIPASVTHLIFGRHYNQNINKSIPPTVTYLELPDTYIGKIESTAGLQVVFKSYPRCPRTFYIT